MTTQDLAQAKPKRTWATWDIGLEVFFLAVVAAIFGLMVWGTRDWPTGAAFFPRMSALLGTPLFAAHVGLRIREEIRKRRSLEPSAATGQILDLGFDEPGVDSKTSRKRSIQMLGSTGALFIGIWVVGFHVSIPAYVFLMLVFYGHAKWWWATLPAAFFAAVIFGVYGYLLSTPWNEPLLVQWFGN